MEVRGLNNSLTFSPGVLMCSGLVLSSDLKKNPVNTPGTWLMNCTYILQYFYSIITVH